MGKIALVTGSCGLIGSESVSFFIERGYTVLGIDNDMRKYFFGDSASTLWNKQRLEEKYKDKYKHYSIDIRDKEAIENIFKKNSFNIVIHTAAQPSHDWAAREPLTDFNVNAHATLILLECLRLYCPEATFIFTSTNKVYGDRVNYLPFVELETRYDLPLEHHYYNGVDESMSIDQCLHSIFGASKVAADILVQEYGRYYKLNTGVFRGGCLTGPVHSGAELHGFLAYLVNCIDTGKVYTIYGYKGKQVRDNIHSYDLVNMFWHFHCNPRPGEVYNVGGSRYSNTSILEAISKIEKILNKKANCKYEPQNRRGDHIWYISDISKFKKHYPEWQFKYSLEDIIEQICRYGHRG